MTILIDDKEAILKKGSSFDYISENRLFTGSDSYTLTMTFPLADCPQNRAIFGNIDRKDVTKDTTVYDCVLMHGSLYRSGVVTITEVTEKEVKTQFLEGRSAQNFERTFDNTFINEFEWGQYPRGLARNFAPGQVWAIRDNFITYTALPWVNSYSGNIQNEARYDGDHGNYTWVYRYGNGQNSMRLSFQPFLIYAVKQILMAMGYTYDFTDWEQSYHRFILICNTLPGAWEVYSFARAMPHWSITELLSQIERLLNAEFDIDHKNKVVTFKYTSSIIHELYDEVIETVIDEYKVDISSENNDKFLPARKRQFADCDHNAWKYYSSPWVLRTLWDRVRTYATMSDFLSTCHDLHTLIMQYNDSQEQEENMQLINAIHYVRSVDTYFAFRNTSMVTREGVVVQNGEVQPSGSYWVYSRNYAPVPINIFGDRNMTGEEDEKVDELKMVPAWLDETDAEHGFMLFLQMNNYDETAEDNLGANDASKLVNPFPLAMIAQGEKQGVKEYYDKIYLAYWDGEVPQNEVPMPWVDTIMIDANWHYRQYPSSLRFDGRDAINYPAYNVDLKKKYTFSFLSDHVPNPRAIFHIDGFRYICEKITATFTENGMSRKMKGVFYKIM